MSRELPTSRTSRARANSGSGWLRTGRRSDCEAFACRRSTRLSVRSRDAVPRGGWVGISAGMNSTDQGLSVTNRQHRSRRGCIVEPARNLGAGVQLCGAKGSSGHNVCGIRPNDRCTGLSDRELPANLHPTPGQSSIHTHGAALGHQMSLPADERPLACIDILYVVV